MADENTIIEGTVKFRDGKKWKSRWCVMRKLSPVADCVQLQLYRGGRGGRGACVAALSLERFVGVESGFTLDKHSNTLALVCRDLVAVLAFETRERLMQWQVKVSAALGAARAHVVLVAGGGGGGGLPPGPARLLLAAGRAALTAGVPPRLLAAFELQHLRRYGVVDGRFCFEGGSLCGKAEGLHALVAERPRDILRDFELAARGRLSPRRRSLGSRRTEGAESPPPGASEAAWSGARPQAGSEDTASLRGGGGGGAGAAGGGGGGVALERCMSCMSKLGALSRSSTAALTPGAQHFSPAWTMEALDEPRAPPQRDVTPRPGDVTCRQGDVTPRPGDVTLPPERPARPARLDLPRSCSCDLALDDCESSGIGPYENYDVPRVPSTEVEGEYYDTPKRLRECFDDELFKITRSSTANTLILKKPCGCLLKFGKRRREPTVVDAEEDYRAAACACQRVAEWAHTWIKLPTCRRAPAAVPAPAAPDKENVTPDAAALYATVDFSRKTRRRTRSGETIEVDTGPLAHYENLNFALSLEYYENAKDMLRRAGVTQTELNAIGANLKPTAFAFDGRGTCAKCKRPARTSSGVGTNDEYLVMEPNAIESDKLERSRAPPSGYTPMSPIAGFAFHAPRRPAKSPVGRPLDEKSASNPSLGAAAAARGARGRPRSSSADSSRFLDDVKEFDGSGGVGGGGGSASSLETLRDAGAGGGAADGKLSDVDSSDASKGREPAPRAAAPAAGGCRDSSSSNDSGVSSCTAPGRRHWRASRRASPHSPLSPRSRHSPQTSQPPPPRPRSTDAPRVSAPHEPVKSSSAEAEVPLLTLRPLRGVPVGADSRSTSSGTSDMSDYIETLSLCSSHSSSDTPVTMRARVTSTLRPRSGREYARLAPGGLRARTDAR